MPRLIREIKVEHLFGRYDYFIPLGGEAAKGSSQMSLLYGDNGTGKTTILNLVFHLLSSDLRRGHKTRIASVPFRSFSVTFSDQTVISASRPSGDLTGNFDLGLSLSGTPSETARVEVDPESGAVPSRLVSSEAVALLNKISRFAPKVFYLGDGRTLESDTLPRRDTNARTTMRSRIVHHSTDEDFVIVERGVNEQREAVLQESIGRTQQQLYVELARASTRGEADARQIYTDVLRSIASANTAPDVSADEKARLEKELKELEDISEKFAEFDLGSAFNATPLAESLSSADERTLPVVVEVLRSFLNGQRARLSALDALYEKMHDFVATTNGYLTDKTVELDISKGLTISIPGGDLNPGHLSSGEQHLLLLFLNMFTSSDQSRLFIIDEPELSLNVKWQRDLVDSLLDLTQNAPCQFLLATHSIELLSKHREYVTQLKP